MMTMKIDNAAALQAIAILDGMDIYLLDQVMKRRFAPGCCLLDAGCGGGRNLHWFLQAGYRVHGIDSNAAAVQQLRVQAHDVAPGLPSNNFRVEPVEKMSFADASFDAVLSIAVLHFARNDAHFDAMLHEMWRVLKPGGVFFARLASSIGIEDLVQPLGDNRFALPDGSTRYLVDQERLLTLASTLGAPQLEPIKTVNVQNLRCMTTWVLEKT